MKLTEYVVNGLITFLEANLPTKLVELQAEYNDGIILDPIKGYYISEKKDVPEFPAIFVIDDETDNEKLKKKKLVEEPVLSFLKRE